MQDVIETLEKELLLYASARGSGKSITTSSMFFDEFVDQTLLIRWNLETYSNMFIQYVKYLRFPTQNEWEYFFMCENIENKELRQKIIECYNYKHKVGQKLKQPCNPNFKKESWRK